MLYDMVYFPLLKVETRVDEKLLETHMFGICIALSQGTIGLAD
jgi:hypothetical protein